MSLKVIVYTPTKIICNTVTEEVVLPTLKAEMSIRPFHKQIMGVLPYQSGYYVLKMVKVGVYT